MVTRDEIIDRLAGYGIPEYMHGGIIRYLFNGICPGDFLTSVICNDLSRSIRYADNTNAQLLRQYIRFFYNETPITCWGSREKMNNWMKETNEHT